MNNSHSDEACAQNYAHRWEFVPLALLRLQRYHAANYYRHSREESYDACRDLRG